MRQRAKNKVKVLIADREGIFRLGLKKLLSLEDDLRVVAQAENPSQTLSMVEAFRPDLAIVQQEIALDEDCRVIKEICGQLPACRVVATASVVSEAAARQMTVAGGSGLISKADRPETFVESIRKVLDGQNVLPAGGSPQGNTPIADGNGRLKRPVDTLTRREKTIVSCLTQGWKNREIAQHLKITEQTVKNHLRSVYDKVGVSDRLELVLYAIHKHLELPAL